MSPEVYYLLQFLAFLVGMLVVYNLRWFLSSRRSRDG